MITLDRASFQTQPRYATYAGLKTDTKPTGSLINNGDEFQEIDTGKLYKFDIDTGKWYEQSGGGSGTMLESIEIVSPPKQIEYVSGQTFVSAGMEVVANYSNGDSVPITNYTFSPNDALSTSDVFIVVSYTEGGVTKTVQQPITVVEPLPTLNDNSWEVISIVSKSGLASTYWAVGDSKQITINTTIGTVVYSNYQPWVYILGFNHNNTLEGNNLIHFGCFRENQDYQANNSIALDDEFYGVQELTQLAFHMNETNTNAGGWKNSLMRNIILNSQAVSPSQATEFSFLAAFPTDLKNVLKKCVKYTNNIGNDNTEVAVTSTEDWVFLLSEWEVQGARTSANEYEQNYQKQYDYYSNGNSKMKYKQTNSGTSSSWWLRSPYVGVNTFFCIVGITGGAFGNTASVSNGFSPAFCV